MPRPVTTLVPSPSSTAPSLSSISTGTQSSVSPSSTATESTTDTANVQMEVDASPSVVSSKPKRGAAQRRSFTLKQKKRVVRKVDVMRLRDPKLTISKAMASFGLQNYYYSRWKKDIKFADNLLKTQVASTDLSQLPHFVAHEDTRKIHGGRKSFLQEHGKTIRDRVFELRERGLQVGVDTVVREASKMSAAFRNKSARSKSTMALRLCKKLGLSHRKPTHDAQKHHKETELLAKAFIDMVRARVRLMNPHCVANMDQTPIPFCYNSNSTLAPKGAATIHMLAPGEKDRCTFNAAITMGGGKLKPMIIFKGQANGRIESREFPTFSTDAFWHAQKNAWCDERVMKSWVSKVLPLWKAECVQLMGPHVIPLLILDAYKCHMQAEVVTMIQDLGIEILHIPGGCTYLCQPLDVGVNRPLTRMVKAQWDDWMETEGASTLQKPSRKQIGEWVLKAWNDLDEQHVRNSRKKKGFKWVL